MTTNEEGNSGVVAGSVPLSTDVPLPPTSVAEVVYPASVGVRFLHMWIDGVASYFFAGAVGGLAWLVLGFELALLIGGLSYIGYYFIFELAFGQTVGKMLTGTKVVALNGEKASVPALLGRNLARYIPFEVFSFLFYGSYPTKGWHDRVSGTLVVPKHLTPEQVQAIDPEKLKGGGKVVLVILIALVGLFMFAVVGIVAAITLAAISDARKAGEVAATKLEEGQVKTEQTELSPEVIEQLRMIVELTKVPTDLGNGIVVERLFVDKTTSALTFEYALANQESADLDIDIFADEVEAGLRNEYCTSSAFAYYLDNNVPLAWVYYDKNKDHIVTVASQSSWCE